MSEPAPPTIYGLKADLAKLQCGRPRMHDIYGPQSAYVKSLIEQENILRGRIKAAQTRKAWGT